MSGHRRIAVLTTGAVLAMVPGVVVALPASAAATSVAVVGNLQSELGCPADWDPACPDTELALVPGTSTWAATFRVPAGSYEYKVALNDTWAESYGDATFNLGGNIPLALEKATDLRFTYDDVTKKVQVGPAQPAEGPNRGDRALAGDSLRTDLTRENFYFVMADRFENGKTSNDTGFIEGTRLQNGFDPTDQGFFHGGDIQGLIDRLDYIEGLGTTAIWMTPSFKNKPVQGAPGSESAGYHGYWITDFTSIDPHLGTNAELKKLAQDIVDAQQREIDEMEKFSEQG